MGSFEQKSYVIFLVFQQAAQLRLDLRRKGKVEAEVLVRRV